MPGDGRKSQRGVSTDGRGGFWHSPRSCPEPLELVGLKFYWSQTRLYRRVERVGTTGEPLRLEARESQVISWELDHTLEMPFVLTTVQRALSTAVPVIWNSDQGSHFTSPHYLQLLQDAHIQISMDSKGRALDNIFTERLWRTVKYEEVYLHDYTSPKEARQQLSSYFEFYNHQRLHQALDYRTPAEVYSTGTPIGSF